MAFIETRINDGLIIYETAGGPGYSTTIVKTFSGFEQRNKNWTRARGRWELGERLCTNAELAAIIAFFRAVGGMAHGFRFKDFADFQVTVANGYLGDTGLATAATTYQMNKKYTAGTQQDARAILKPISATITVFVNGSLKTPGVDYILNTDTGIITWLIQPSVGAALTWAGQFDVPTRFDVDEIKSRFDATDGTESLHYLYSLPILELLQAA